MEEKFWYRNSLLPAPFRQYGRLDSSDVVRIESFFRHFVWNSYSLYKEGHLVLACYAALPAALTPDLLYRLWLNFRQYTTDGDQRQIHRVAVSDILLSPLVEQTGPELFEMPNSIRNAMLYYWRDILQGGDIDLSRQLGDEPTEQKSETEQHMAPLEDVAHFLLQYAESTEAHRVGPSFVQGQRWTAESFLNPSAVAGELARDLHQAQDPKTGSPVKQARISDAISNMGDRVQLGLTTKTPGLEFTYLQHYLRAEQQRSYGNIEQAAEWFKGIDPEKLADAPHPNAVASFRIPEELAPKVPEHKSNVKNLVALLVGINEYPIKHHRIMGAVPDMKAFDQYLRKDSLRHGINYIPKMLTDDEATREGVTQNFLEHFEQLEDGDIGLFYFSGQGSRDRIGQDLMGGLVCWDSRIEGGRDLFECELSWLTWKATKDKNVEILIIIDSCHVNSLRRPIKL